MKKLKWRMRISPISWYTKVTWKGQTEAWTAFYSDIAPGIAGSFRSPSQCIRDAENKVLRGMDQGSSGLGQDAHLRECSCLAAVLLLRHSHRHRISSWITKTPQSEILDFFSDLSLLQLLKLYSICLHVFLKYVEVLAGFIFMTFQGPLGN